MNRTRLSSLEAFGLRDQRNRIYPALEASDGSTLSLDFTQMSSLDSRFTFSRSTQGTFINSSGYVAWSDVNLVRDSIGFAVSGATSRGWGVPGSATTGTYYDRNGVASNASRASYKQTGSISVTWSPDSIAALATGVVARFWIRGVTDATRIDMGWYQSTLGWGSASDGSCTIVGGYSNGVTITSQSGVLFKVENLSTTEWTQLEVKRSTRFDYFAMYFGGASATSSSLTHAFEFSDFQINLGTVAKPFVATSNAGGAGLQAPRFDYNPTTRAPRGLLIEGSATNLLKNSTYADTGWIAYGSYTKSYTTGITSPANDTTAARITFSAVTNGLYTNNTQMTYTNTVGATYTFSAWIRATSNTTNPNIRFGDSAVALGSDIPISTNWARYSYSYTAISNSGPSIQSGSGTATGEFEMWGFQLEAGNGASSYIPTGTSQLTRAADECFIADASPFQVSTTNGTLYWSGIIHKQTPSSYTEIVGFMNASVPTFEVWTNGLNIGVAARGTSLSAGGDNEVTRTYTLNAQTRYACSVNTTSNPIVAAILNGGTVGTKDKSGTGDLFASTRFVLGRQPTATYGSFMPCMTFAQVKYWPVTKTQAELNSLTTT